MKYSVYDHCQKNSIKNFRNNNTGKIYPQTQSAPQQELKCINRQIIQKIHNRSQQHRYFYIIIIINTKCITAQESRIHIDQCIKPKNGSIKQIHKQTTEEGAEE